jgi:hypothetical protein
MGKRLGVAMLFFAFSLPILAQETRSMLFGKVMDPQGASIIGADVAIRNAETGVT